ncbi:MAG: type II secretion system protein [Bacilli bacterium]|nr:type II secretion system protein [Bacilli bacterium]
MNNKKGYTVPELVAIIALTGIIALICISKTSYAFKEINDPDIQKEEVKSLVQQATKAYVKSKEEDFKKEEVTYIYAKEVATAGFLFEKDAYNSMKIKISYQKESNSFEIEVVE